MIKFLPKNERECPICHHDLDFESIDYRFYGNQDEFYLCSCCGYSLIARIRFGKVWKKDVYIRHDEVMKDD